MTALALREDQTYWDEKQIAVLQAGGIDQDVTEAELMAFLHECQRRQLDPFSRQIYLIGRKDKAKGRKVYRSQTSIDGFRLIARRAADKSGIDYSYEDTIWYDAEGGRHEIWLSGQPPSGAKVVVIRGGSRFDAVARFGAYVQTDWNGNPTRMWQSMPDVMVAKCAEALALRKAFPEDLGGIYTEEEMGQADNLQRVTATAEVVRDDPPARLRADVALERAGAFKSESEAQALWEEVAAAALAGHITRKEKDQIQNTITKRIKARRRQAAEQILQPLDDGDPWRDKILDGIGNQEEARTALAELQDLSATGELDTDKARLFGRAIIALHPKAALAEATA